MNCFQSGSSFNLSNCIKRRGVALFTLTNGRKQLWCHFCSDLCWLLWLNVFFKHSETVLCCQKHFLFQSHCNTNFMWRVLLFRMLPKWNSMQMFGCTQKCSAGRLFWAAAKEVSLRTFVLPARKQQFSCVRKWMCVMNAHRSVRGQPAAGNSCSNATDKRWQKICEQDEGLAISITSLTHDVICVHQRVKFARNIDGYYDASSIAFVSENDTAIELVIDTLVKIENMH